MLLAAFRIKFPEFTNVADALVQANLDEATLELDAGVWGLKFDTAHGYLAAHKLTLSPYGQAARLNKNSEVSTYQKHYEKLQAQVSPGWIRVC